MTLTAIRGYATSPWMSFIATLTLFLAVFSTGERRLGALDFALTLIVVYAMCLCLMLLANVGAAVLRKAAHLRSALIMSAIGPWESLAFVCCGGLLVALAIDSKQILAALSAVICFTIVWATSFLVLHRWATHSTTQRALPHKRSHPSPGAF